MACSSNSLKELTSLGGVKIEDDAILKSCWLGKPSKLARFTLVVSMPLAALIKASCASANLTSSDNTSDLSTVPAACFIRVCFNSLSIAAIEFWAIFCASKAAR